MEKSIFKFAWPFFLLSGIGIAVAIIITMIIAIISMGYGTIIGMYYGSWVIFISAILGIIVTIIKEKVDIKEKRNLIYSILAFLVVIVLFLSASVVFLPSFSVGYNTHKIFNYAKVTQFERMQTEIYDYEEKCHRYCSNLEEYGIYTQYSDEFNQCIESNGCSLNIKNNCQRMANLGIKYKGTTTLYFAYNCFKLINRPEITNSLCEDLGNVWSLHPYYYQVTLKGECEWIANDNVAIKNKDFDACSDEICKMKLVILSKDIEKCHNLNISGWNDPSGIESRFTCVNLIDPTQITIQFCNELNNSLVANSFYYSGSKVVAKCYYIAQNQ